MMSNIKIHLNKIGSLIITVCILMSIFTISANAVETTSSFGEPKIYSEVSSEIDFSDSRVLVVMSNNASLELNEYSVEDFSEVELKNTVDLSSATREKAKKQLDELNYAARNLTLVDSENFVSYQDYNQVVCLELKVSGKNNVIDAVKALQQREDVIYAGPDYAICGAALEPNDSLYGLQSWYTNMIELDEAWAITTGSSNVVVGVVDSGIRAGQWTETGIEGGHEDLINRVDRIYSHDYVNETNDGDSIIQDENGHGTHIAGIIGAEGDNDKGVCGVCWDVTLVSLRVLDSQKYGYSSDVCLAINSAKHNGIDILNMSLSFATYITENMDYYDCGATCPMYESIDNFDGLVVCAAGNGVFDDDINDYVGVNNDIYPLYPGNFNSLSNVITVGACDIYDRKTGFSNYGKTTVDLFAPGQDIWNTYFSYIDDSDYHYCTGTSMAAPMVTGVAALLLSIHPELAAAQLKQIIMSSVDIVYDDEGNSVYEDYCVSGGRLNAYKALTTASIHTFEKIGDGNSSTHNIMCSVCGYIDAVQGHTFVCGEIDGEHATYCVGCEYKKLRTMTYTGNSVFSGHTAVCSQCGHSGTEAHDWLNLKGTYTCLKCGISSAFVPVNNLPPELLAVIQAKTLSGNFALAIDEDTVLCCLDGEYYYVKGQTEANALQYLEDELASLTVVKPEVQTE